MYAIQMLQKKFQKALNLHNFVEIRIRSKYYFRLFGFIIRVNSKNNPIVMISKYLKYWLISEKIEILGQRHQEKYQRRLRKYQFSFI